MNSAFNRSIAHATGESLSTIRSRGFSVLELDIPRVAAGRLCISCPGCGHDVSLARQDVEPTEWAECEQCDIAYPYDDEEVFLPDDELVAV
jgi:hypothetical protein